MLKIWYLAICAECGGGLARALADQDIAPLPFPERDMRTSWVNAHMEATGHSILLMDQCHDATTQPTQKKDDDDATT